MSTVTRRFTEGYHTANRRFPSACDGCRVKESAEAPIQNKCSMAESPDYPTESLLRAFLYFVALTLSSAVVGQGMMWLLKRLFN